MLSIYKRELKSYFTSITGFIFLAFVMVYSGIYFVFVNLSNGYPTFSYTLSSLELMLMVGIPILTMRSFAEERRNRTDQMLYTAPVSVTGIVLGKYLAMVTVMAIYSLLSIAQPFIMAQYGTVNITAALVSILAFFLIGCAETAMGMFISSLTENQIISVVGTFAILLLLRLMSSLSSAIPSTAIASFISFLVIVVLVALFFYVFTKNAFTAAIVLCAGVILVSVLYMVKQDLFTGAIQTWLNSIGLMDRFDDFASDTLNLASLFYFISVAFVFNFLTVRMIEKRRWS